MRRLAPVLGVIPALVAAVMLTAACTPKDDGTPGPGGTTGTTATTGSPATGGATPDTTPAEGGVWKVRYGFAVPSARITITNPSLIPLPYLAEIHTGDHSNENPAYARISFYFRGGMPGYNLQYAKEVLTEGKGDPVKLEGNSFLRFQFTNARTHDDAGKSTIKVAPKPHIGYQNLISYGFGGDFEGYVTYGLGIKVAANSDQVLPIRVGELTKKPDGSGGYFYVVAIDVRNG
jgi:hypothetical protein